MSSLGAMFSVAVRCKSLFHEEIEGSESIVLLDRQVADQAELDALLDRGVDLHGRCYCGHATKVTKANVLLIEPSVDPADAG